MSIDSAEVRAQRLGGASQRGVSRWGGWGAMRACGLFGVALGALVACGGGSPNPGINQTMSSIASSGCSGGDQSTASASSNNAGSSQPSGNSHSTSSSKSPGTSTGATGVVPGSATSNTITVNGTDRTYVLYTPSTYNGSTPLPLIVAFHGDGGTGESLREWFNIEPTVAEQAIIVYPDGLNATWEIDQIGGLMADVNFVDAVVDDLATNGCIAINRLYATGISRGAYFTNQMVCRSAHTWRAVVTHSGGGPYNAVGENNFTCKKQIAALQVHGDADDTVNQSEGWKPSDFWCSANGCNSCPASESQPTASVPYSQPPCMTYNGCKQPEVWCLIPGLNHEFWSQAAKVTWDFFSQH